MKREAQTPKERRFVLEYIATGNATEAAMRAYDCSTRDSARSLGAQTLAKLSIADLLRESGLDELEVITTLRDGLKATRSQLGTNGQVTAHPDYYVRHRYLETAIKLLERFPAEKSLHQVDARVENLQDLLASLEDATQT